MSHIPLATYVGMLTAAVAPFLVTYLVRASSSASVYVDCAAVYRGPANLTNFPGHPDPPFYSTSSGCEESTICDAKTGQVGTAQADTI